MKQLISYEERPSKIEDIIGQKHILGDGKIISKMINNKFLFSIIFYGPPGVGKTSLCLAICKTLEIPFKIFNPTNDKKNLLDEIIELSNLSSSHYAIIIDEIHRMHKDKQDVLLNSLEKGKLILFGTTTENPYFIINPAIRSRCKLVELYPLSNEEIKSGLKNLINKNQIKISSDALDLIVKKNNGDYRSAINLLQILSDAIGDKKITINDVNNTPFNKYEAAQSYEDDVHDLKSALQKSIRGSDPDAAIYWLARLLQYGDVATIGRRLLICAYEDIGLANPQLLSRVHNAISSAKEVGMPEAQYILSFIVLDMALSPKSNSATNAIAAAVNDLDNGKVYNVPNHIKYHNNNLYKYSHDYPDGWVLQEYLPKPLLDKKYYIPPNHSKIELKILDYWNKIKKMEQ
ncbi:MAG: replication-associated recombination protein A [Mycoplasmoidaceae bacterium]